MPTDHSVGYYLNTYAPTIAWVIVAIGLYINHRQQNKLNTRKEVYEIIKNIEMSIESICKRSKQAHPSNKKRKNRELAITKILNELENIDSFIEILLIKRINSTASIYVNQLRKAHESFYEFSSGDDLFNSLDTPDSRVEYVFKSHQLGNNLKANLHQVFVHCYS